MMIRAFKLFIIFLAVIPLLFLFQNCSGANTNATLNTLSSASASVPDYIALPADEANSLLALASSKFGEAESSNSYAIRTSGEITGGSETNPVNEFYLVYNGTVEVSEFYGNLYIVSDGSGSVIISGDIVGNVVLYGVNAKLISTNKIAYVYLKNADVNEIESFEGNVIIENGQVLGNISDFAGNLVWRYEDKIVSRTYSGF